jgi:hypothetical protein
LARARIKIVEPEHMPTTWGPVDRFTIDLGPGNGVGVIFAFEAEHAETVAPDQLRVMGQTLGDIANPAQAMLVVVPHGAKFKVLRVDAGGGKRRRARVH